MRYGMQKGAINQQQRKGIFLNNTLLSTELQKVGYATGMVGKWCVSGRGMACVQRSSPALSPFPHTP